VVSGPDGWHIGLIASDQASESRATKQILCVGIIPDFGKGILPAPSDRAYAAAFPAV